MEFCTMSPCKTKISEKFLSLLVFSVKIKKTNFIFYKILISVDCLKIPNKTMQLMNV